jgi:ATP-dependent DNA helicase RecQ
VYSFADVVSMRRMIESSEGDDRFKFIRRSKLNALLGYCEAVECRRKTLLNHFGEKYEGNCGNCDNCLHPVETWDGTVAAQKALSCVYRTGQRFGAGHLVNVLMGKQTAQVQRWNHERIKTFGVGTDLDADTWMSVFRQLVSAGMLSVAADEYGRLYLNDDSWPVLKGRRDVFFRKDLVFGRGEKTRTGAAGARPGGGLELVDHESRTIFERLRQLRLEIARELNVPPFVIFHDKTLKEMAADKPTTPEAFRRITGVGSAKAARYSEVFLDCIRGREIDLSGYKIKMGSGRGKLS